VGRDLGRREVSRERLDLPLLSREVEVHGCASIRVCLHEL
jgi:hypothetical protein